MQAVLPEYMVPSAFVYVEALPLSPNGKVDRKALPRPDTDAYIVREYEAPLGEVEETLAQVWSEVLDVERVGRHDNFFELGGHSLLAIRVIDRIRGAGLHTDIRTLFTSSTLADLAQRMGAEDAFVVPPNLIRPDSAQITPEMLPLVRLSEPEIAKVVGTVEGGIANIQDIYPLAPLQEGILFHHLLEPERDPYVSYCVYRFDDRERVDAFVDALERVIARHDILRTAVVWEGLNEPVQVVWRTARLRVEEVAADASGSQRLEAFLSQCDPRSCRLDVRRAPLWRVVLTREASGNRWMMMLFFHHLVVDHETLDAVFREVHAYVHGRAAELPQPVAFRDFIARSRAQGTETHAAFFREMLGDVDAPTAPYGQVDVLGDGSGVAHGRRMLQSALSNRLRNQARALGVSTASICHLAWARVLSALCGLDDVVFGTVLLGRGQSGAQAQRALGLFINTLPFRVKLQDAGVAKSVRRIHTDLARLLQHEHASLALAQRCSSLPAPAPLFSAILNYRHMTLAHEARVATWDGMETLRGEERTNYPVTLSIDDFGEGLGLNAQVVGTLDPESICEYMQTALEQLVEALEAAPESSALAIDVLPQAERHRMLVEWNATETAYPSYRCIHELFEAQVAANPDAVAVVHEQSQLTYGELNARANQLAHHLREIGVKPDTRVALCVERSPEMMVALLAILKAGGAYVPLDPSYPSDRLVYMVSDSEPLVVLTHDAVSSSVREILRAAAPVLVLGDYEKWENAPVSNPERAQTPEHLAYIIYTSGSTGQPKGVMIEHRSVVNRLAWTPETFTLDARDAVLQKTPLTFDVSVWELFWPLLRGAKVVLARAGGHKDPDYLAEIMQTQRITTAHFVPSMLHLFLEREGSEQFSHLARVICSGEALSPSAVRQFHERLPHTELYNFYGPTEAAIEVTAFHCDPQRPLDIVPIGRPIANVRTYILNAHREPVPVGVAGELYIGGVQVARGYWKRPDLTQERFVPSPFVEGDRLYKTGDLARYLPDGTIEFLGRNDFQVKIRGFRVELGEIEARLLEQGAIREAVVIAREDVPGEQRLVAYYTSNDVPVDAELLRAHVQAVLPEYMVPSAFVYVEALPLTSNGKVDRKALPAPDARAYIVREYEAPLGEVEETLAQIWREILKVDRVGRHDNFFELGGHSLLASRMLLRVRQSLQADVRLMHVFANPVLLELARVVAQAVHYEASALVQVAREQPLLLSSAQQRLWFLAQMDGASQAYHIPLNLRLSGALDRSSLVKALGRIVERHEALRTTFAVLDAVPVQCIAGADSGFALLEHDLRDCADREAELARLRALEIDSPFDLESGPLIRGRLLRLEADEYVLLITMHHIVSDGWSMGLLLREFGALYAAYRDGKTDPLPALTIQYADYAAWERGESQSVASQAQRAYWQRMLMGAPPVHRLPLDRPRPAYQEYAGASIDVALDAELTAGLRALSRRHGTTLYTTLLTAWGIVLARLSGEDDIVVGTPVANRARAEIETLIGFFVNTLALRLDLSGTPTVSELLERVTAQTLAAQEHQDVPFEQVVEAVAPPRSLSYAPLIQVVFAWQNNEHGELTLPGLDVIDIGAPAIVSKFDLTLSLAETEERIAGALEYATALFDRSTVERYVGYLHAVLAAMVADDRQHIGLIPLMSQAEHHRLVVEWNATERDYPADRCIHELFEAQVAANPDAVAVVHEQSQLTYGELNVRANQLAHHLREIGVKPDTRVALCVERSPEMMVALLAILKAGGAYVPLDP
ncbi:MAG: amino acid adenylation domain-containing protein, partial [Acidimicrobiales bacterium]